MNRINQSAIFDVIAQVSTENLNGYVNGNIPDVITKQFFDSIKWLPKGKDVHGDEKSLPCPVSFQQFSTLYAEAKANREYSTNRRNEYPSLEEQLDTIFHSGIEVWKEQIQAIKDKYPKPE